MLRDNNKWQKNVYGMISIYAVWDHAKQDVHTYTVMQLRVSWGKNLLFRIVIIPQEGDLAGTVSIMIYDEDYIYCCQ